MSETQDRELLAWAAMKLQNEQEAKTYGTVTFHLENGMIIRSEVKRLDKPDAKKCFHT